MTEQKCSQFRKYVAQMPTICTDEFESLFFLMELRLILESEFLQLQCDSFVRICFVFENKSVYSS